MKRYIRLKDIIILSILLITSIACTFFAHQKGRENIYPLVEKALSQTIDTDYYRRMRKDFSHKSGKGLGRKMKGIKIQTENGIENIEFKDSIEEERAYQLVNQYMGTIFNPLQPHDFNEIFQKELSNRNVDGKTGIIYYHGDVAHSSEQDLTSIPSAIQSEKVFIDIKETAAVKAWVNCSFFTCLRHSSLIALAVMALAILMFFLYLVLTIKKAYQQMRQNPTVPYIITIENKVQKAEPEQNPETAVPEKGISIDSIQQLAYIDGKLLTTTSMTFNIFQLLAENMETFVTRQQLEKVLWENSEKEDAPVIGNRLHQNVSKLRKALKDFPQYEIIGGKGKGYKLTQTTTEDEMPGI